MKTFLIIAMLVIGLSWAYQYDIEHLQTINKNDVRIAFSNFTGYTLLSADSYSTETIATKAKEVSASGSAPIVIAGYSRGGDVFFTHNWRFHSLTVRLLLPALIILYAWFFYLAYRKQEANIIYDGTHELKTWHRAIAVIALVVGVFTAIYSVAEIIDWSFSIHSNIGVVPFIAALLGLIFMAISVLFCSFKVCGVDLTSRDGLSRTDNESSTILPLVMLMTMSGDSYNQ